MNWEPVIGLEIHAQLATDSKIFCPCPNHFGDEPNTNVCPVCTGQPGVLPVLNESAVALAIKAAVALNLTINKRSIFARKHYFYPDLPKAFQISQYELPYSENGWLDVNVDGEPARFGITRIHMEEDAGKNVHGDGDDTHSYVDFNRTGSPLIEIVSEPDFRSAAQAGAYMREVHSILRYAGISDADMEKGNFRCDANVSVRPMGQAELGTKAEIKNVNSFRFVERAIDYEIQRQIAVLESGGEVVQETRLWDSNQNKTYSMRSKEEAHDYRYFPEPDLPPLVITDEQIEHLSRELPELPPVKRKRYIEELGLSADDAYVLTGDRDIAEYFENTVAIHGDARLSANWVVNDVLPQLDGPISDFPVGAERLAQLLKLLNSGAINGKGARQVFEQMLSSKQSPQEIVDQKGLGQISDSSELESIVDQLIESYPDEAQRFRDGDSKLMSFFMGQVMKETRGKANPGTVQQLLKDRLGA